MHVCFQVDYFVINAFLNSVKPPKSNINYVIIVTTIILNYSYNPRYRLCDAMSDPEDVDQAQYEDEYDHYNYDQVKIFIKFP